LKRDWNPAKWSLSHIFQIIRCLLIVPFPESALNEEAGRLFMESYDEYHSQAKLLANIHARPKPQQLALMKSHYSEIEDEISTFKPKQEQNLVKQDFNQGTTI
jgi:hypothetical protein